MDTKNDEEKLEMIKIDMGCNKCISLWNWTPSLEVMRKMRHWRVCRTACAFLIYG